MSALTVLVALRVDAESTHTELVELAEATNSVPAYLQVGRPSLRRVLDDAAARGVRTIRLVQAPGQHGKPGRSWLSRVAGHWVRENPEVVVTVEDSSGRQQLVTGREAPLQSPAWEELPAFRRHVLVCRGPRCAAQDSERTAQELAASVTAAGLGDEDVMLTQSGCLYPCNHAPVVAVYPDDIWYGGITADSAAQLVAEHLVQGRPLSRATLPRRR